jgi:hypothetical protein
MKYLRLTYVLGILILLMLGVSVPGNAQDWRRIKLLETVRPDVERLFGPSSEGYAATYVLQDGVLFLEYSSGTCRPDRKGGWNVEEYTVVSLRFVPKSKQRLARLNLDLRKFRKVVDDHVGGVTYYTNDEEGVTYEVQFGRVDAINYLPGKRYNSMQCRE